MNPVLVRAGVSLLGLALLLPGAVAAQVAPIQLPVTLESSAPPRVPFRPGEVMNYDMKLGILNVGSGWMAVQSVDSIRGAPSYYFSMGMDASMMFGTVQLHDRYHSWMDVRTMASRRYIREIDQPGYESYREFEIYPEERRWARTDKNDDKTGVSLSDAPLDEISFIYFLRTIPLEVGQEYTFDTYFKEEGNPVVVRVLRRETKETSAGSFETIVVQPIFKTSGLFGDGGKAELYFTDDANRYLVYLRSEVPGFQSMTLHLRSVEQRGVINERTGG